MTCWVVPLIAAVFTLGISRGFRLKNPHNMWLILMFTGGGLFGVIDHLWYGELFVISKYWLADLALGGTITGGIFGGWSAIVFAPKITRLVRYHIGILDV
ncbi:hypothetical protein ACFL96_11950 [Thermoproteota archaeon]